MLLRKNIIRYLRAEFLAQNEDYWRLLITLIRAGLDALPGIKIHLFRSFDALLVADRHDFTLITPFLGAYFIYIY